MVTTRKGRTTAQPSFLNSFAVDHKYDHDHDHNHDHNDIYNDIALATKKNDLCHCICSSNLRCVRQCSAPYPGSNLIGSDSFDYSITANSGIRAMEGRGAMHNLRSD